MNIFQRFLPLALLCATLCFSAGCDSKSSPQTSASLKKTPSHRVVAVSYPLQFLAQRIAGSTITVEFPVPAEQDPRKWRPDREAIQKFQKADLIVANGTGATYAEWLATVTLPESKICNTASRGMSLRDFIQVDDVNLVHSHGPEGEHSHPMMVAETWLDPTIAMKQAKYIAKELTRVYPNLKATIDENKKALDAELQPFVDRLEAIKEKQANVDQPNDQPASFFSANPSMKFLTRAAGITDIHFNWDADSIKQLTGEGLKIELKKKFKEPESTPSKILVPKSLTSPALSLLLTELKIAPIEIDTIQHKPSDDDYLSQLDANISALEKAMK